MANRQAVIASTGASSPIVMDLSLFRYGVGLLVYVPPTVTAVNYGIQVSGDNPLVGPGQLNLALLNWNNHDIYWNITNTAGSTPNPVSPNNPTGSINGNLAFPCTAVRLFVAGYVGTGNIVLNVVTTDNA